jgi:methionyl aminopeptidase
MSIRTRRELEKLREIGAIVRFTLDTVALAVKPGVSTRELDRLGGETLRAHAAQSAPPKVYGFPGHLCISVNQEAIHGIPGERRIEEGDLVKLDLVAEKDGFHADAALSVVCGAGSSIAQGLRECAESAFWDGLREARIGNRAYDIGRAVEKRVHVDGFRVIRELCGHGVGRTIHEAPSIPNYRDTNCRARLSDGLVITIEPILSAGSGKAALAADGWTIRTTDNALAAHFEHTVVITAGEPILLTA